jgi:hypothetical protein
VPRPLVPGSFQASRIPAGELEGWHERMRAARVTGDVPDCALFWADGKRSIAEITWLVSQELGIPTPDLETFFSGMEEYGYVELRDT